MCARAWMRSDSCECVCMVLSVERDCDFYFNWIDSGSFCVCKGIMESLTIKKLDKTRKGKKERKGTKNNLTVIATLLYEYFYIVCLYFDTISGCMELVSIAEKFVKLSRKICVVVTLCLITFHVHRYSSHLFRFLIYCVQHTKQNVTSPVNLHVCVSQMRV